MIATNKRILPVAAGSISLAMIFAVMAGAMLALAATAIATQEATARIFDPYILRVIKFTLWQALLSAGISIAFAIPVALALARRQSFPGRTLLLRLFALPLALPALVVVLGVVEVWGRTGWINSVAQTWGMENPFSIYGLPGILIAHVFFNLPLATRLLLVHFDRIPGETWRLAAQLGLPRRIIFRLIELPVLRAAVPGIVSLIFMLCIASFTVVLTLGGGPRATTIEVAIYQALRFDFDPGRAVILALIQICLTAVLIVAIGRFAADMAEAPSLGKQTSRPDLKSVAGRLFDAIIIMIAAAFVLVPLIGIVIDGVRSDITRLVMEPIVWRSIATSALIASAASVTSVILTWSLLVASRGMANVSVAQRLFNWFSGAARSLILVMPPIVLGAGWFVLLRGYADIYVLAPVMVIVINALMALPFVVRILKPAMIQASARHDRLCASLGLTGWHRFRLIDGPVMLRPFALSLAFAAALSIGDLGVIALFGNEDFITLPFLLYQRFGSYRIDDAAGLALLLMAFCLCLIAIAERVGEPRYTD